MKVVVASDSFKGSMSSFEVGQAVKKGILQFDPNVDVDIAGIADGGDGSMDVIRHAGLDAEEIKFKTTDLMGWPLDSVYLMTKYKKAPMAIIETANTVGINLIYKPTSTTFEEATSFGVGTQIRDAIKKGAKRVIVLTGGTGVSDGGLGMLQALGVNFFDQNNHILGRDQNLLNTDFQRIDGLGDVVSQFSHIDIMIATDVDNHYAGINGAQGVFGPQKGGTPEQIKKFDQKMQYFQEIVDNELDFNLSVVDGAGAAGGIGGALAVIGGRVVSGFDVIARLINLRQRMESADLVITGEGRLDFQSHHGKAPYRVAEVAREMDIPVFAIGGQIDASLHHFEKMDVPFFSIQRGPISRKQAMNPKTALGNITCLIRNLMRLWKM